MSDAAVVRHEALWAQVHLLGVIAEYGSFTQAAQRLGVSKAAVSERLAELERHVGVPLVQRTTRSVRLTEAGRQLVEETTDPYAQIARSVAGLRAAAGAPRGLLRVTAPVALGRQHVAPCVIDFLGRFPDIRVEVDLSDRLVPLAREGFDLAIRHTSAPPETHTAVRLCGSRAVLVASTDYVARHGAPAMPDALAGHACLPYLRPGRPVWHFAQSGADGSRVRVAVNGVLHVNNSEVLRDAVLGGLGIGLLPDFSAQAALRAGRLVELLPDWRPVGFFGDAVYALWPWRPQTPRPLQLLVEHLRRSLSAGFGTDGDRPSVDRGR